MGTDQIMCCIVALILGMLMANMLKNVCGCKTVEGQPRILSEGGTQCEGPANPNNCFTGSPKNCKARKEKWDGSCCSDGKVVLTSSGAPALCSDITDSFECQHSDPTGDPKWGENLWNHQDVHGVKQSCKWRKKGGFHPFDQGECVADSVCKAPKSAPGPAPGPPPAPKPTPPPPPPPASCLEDGEVCHDLGNCCPGSRCDPQPGDEKSTCKKIKV